MHRPRHLRASLDGEDFARLYLWWLRPFAGVVAGLAVVIFWSVQSADQLVLVAGIGSMLAAVTLGPALAMLGTRYGALRVAHPVLYLDCLMTLGFIYSLQDAIRFGMAFIWSVLLGALMLSLRASVTLTCVVAVSIAALPALDVIDRPIAEAMLQAVFVAILGIGIAWVRNRELVARRKMLGAQVQLRYAQQLAHLGSWEWDSSTDQSYWSDELRRVFGLPEDTPAHLRSFLDRVVPEQRDAIATLVDRARATGDMYQFDATISRADTGEHRVIEVIGTPGPMLRSTDRPRYYGSVQDVTEQRHLDQMKSEFVATASHELRTPAAIIIGFAATLRHQWETLSDGQRVAFVGEIERAGTRLNQLIEDVLQVTRIESGQIRCERAPFDLLGEVRGLLAQWPSTPRPTLEIDDMVSTSDGMPTPVTVIGDPLRTAQVLTNLLVNAELHTPRGTTVRVEVRAMDDVCRVEVVDDGPGIGDADRERIFARFVRLDSAERGTGLGLYISRSLMEAQGGTLALEPRRPGEGARFVIELPRQSTSSSTSSG